MNRIKQAIHLLLAVPLICVVLSGHAFASSSNALWPQVTESSDTVSAVVEANTVISDGTIQVTFDPDKLTYTGCDFVGNGDQYTSHVAMHAVNDAQAQEGVVRIAWVASDTSSRSDGVNGLFPINFKASQSGVTAEDISISGTANSPDGQPVAVGQAPTPPTEQSPAPTVAPTQQPDTPAASTAPGTDSNEGQPDTGDHANLTLYLVMTVVCATALVLAGVCYAQRRRTK